LKVRRHAPLLGEHSVEILTAAGVAAADVEALLRGGATIDGALKNGNEPALSRRIAGQSPMP
jgi:hypothetical protein